MNHEEHRIQAAAIKALSAYPDTEWLFAIPNGGARNVITGSRLKAEGVRKGVWDLMYSYGQYSTASHEMYSGMFIEVKTEKGKLSEEQARFGAHANSNGYAIAICRSAQQIVDAVILYRNGEWIGNGAAMSECLRKIEGRRK